MSAVVLHHYLDWPLERVAEALGIPPGTARYARAVGRGWRRR